MKTSVFARTLKFDVIVKEELHHAHHDLTIAQAAMEARFFLAIKVVR